MLCFLIPRINSFEEAEAQQHPLAICEWRWRRLLKLRLGNNQECSFFCCWRLEYFPIIFFRVKYKTERIDTNGIMFSLSPMRQAPLSRSGVRAGAILSLLLVTFVIQTLNWRIQLVSFQELSPATSWLQSGASSSYSIKTLSHSL